MILFSRRRRLCAPHLAWWWTGVALAALACQLTLPATTPQPTAVNTPIATVAESAVAPVMPAVTTSSPGPAPASWRELGDWLNQVYGATIPADQVQAALQAAGWQESAAEWHSADLDGDGRDDWLLTLFTHPDEAQPEPFPYGRSGDFWVVNGSGVTFRATADGLDWFQSAPVLLTLDDLTGDGRTDAIVETTLCGASTCFQDYRILSAHHGLVANVVRGADNARTVSISFAEAETGDFTGDGLSDLHVHGGTLGSAGAGLHRGYTEVWSWNGSFFSRRSRQYDASDIRFHRLYEADEALATGDTAAAEAAYWAAIDDESLVDAEWIESAAVVRDAVRRFAAFRLAWLALADGRNEEAGGWRDWLAANYPNTALTDAAVLLLASYDQNGGDLAAACTAVTAQLLPVDSPTGPLADTGYGNPSLTAVDVCPRP